MNSPGFSSRRPLRIVLFGECMIELSGEAFGPLTQSYGGDTFNTASYLVRCAGPHFQVMYATALGDDSLSDGLLERWQSAGIDTHLVRRVTGKLPGLYMIETDPRGERKFTFWRDNSAARDYFDIDITPLEGHESDIDAFYFSGISLAILPPEGRDRLFALGKRLRERGVPIIFDNNFRSRLWPDVEVAQLAFAQAFSLASIALVTADDHQFLYRYADAAEATASACALPTPEVVIKQGSEPSLVRIAGCPLVAVPTYPASRVVDTTAAGDSFAAGYLSRRLLGASVELSADFGNRLAARVIQHPGALIPMAAMADLAASVNGV